jgi:hypothetical protein
VPSLDVLCVRVPMRHPEAEVQKQITVTIAPGDTIAAPDPDGVPVVLHAQGKPGSAETLHGPGSKIVLPRSEAQRMRRLGYVI